MGVPTPDIRDNCIALATLRRSHVRRGERCTALSVLSRYLDKRARMRGTGARKADSAASHELRLNYVVFALAYAQMRRQRVPRD
jgi:hypothetical protein